MRRPQSAFGLVAVMSSLLVASLFPASVQAARMPAESEPAQTFDASGRCTAWTSQFVPPKTIRVLRTSRTGASNKVAGTVQTVAFRDYVEVVMAQEWPEHYPLETIKAGAVATKQFAWYYILNWRGGNKWYDGKKHCYDVVDDTTDQWYSPEDETVLPDGKIAAALDATWGISLRKFKQTTQSSRMFLTGYRAGSGSAECGADATGFKLFHNSTKKCGNDGLKFREILRLYLKPNLEIVEPGLHDVIGTKHGDATAMIRDGSQWAAHAWTPGQNSPEPGSRAGINISTVDLLGYVSGDLNGDGDDDLVWLRKTGNKAARVKVAISDGTNYGPDAIWWEGDTIVPVDGSKVVVGDFNADDRVDVGLLGQADDPEKSKLIVLRRKKYSAPEKFLEPEQWWSGSQDIDKVRNAWAGDVSGDGRADLILRQNIDTGGVKVKTAVTRSPLPGGAQKMHGLKVRFESHSMDSAKVKMTVGDANRDGRADVVMLIGGAGSTRVERLQGQLLGGFKRVKIWTAPKSDPIPVGKTRLGIGDVDYDGRSDLVLYIKKDGDAKIRVLKARYDTMKNGPSWRTSHAWNDLRPY